MRVSLWTIHKHSSILNIDYDFFFFEFGYNVAANASEPNSINTATNEPHFVSALARMKPFLFLDWLFQGIVKRHQYPCQAILVLYVSLLSCFVWRKCIDYIREGYVFLSEHSSLVKNSCKKLSGVGVGVQKKRTFKFFLGVEGGRGRIKEHFLQFLKFCHSSLCYGFTNFKLLVFLDHLKYGYFPNMGYFNSSVLTSLSKEEAVFSKL